MNKTIHGFTGEWAKLNPAYAAACSYDGDVYPSILAAVEASKFPKDGRMAFQLGSSSSFKYGYLKPYTDVQLQVLRELLEERFAKGTPYRVVLDKTKGCDLIDANNAHRNWYGVCTCTRCEQSVKHNYVGEILEEIRDRT